MAAETVVSDAVKVFLKSTDEWSGKRLDAVMIMDHRSLDFVLSTSDVDEDDDDFEKCMRLCRLAFSANR